VKTANGSLSGAIWGIWYGCLIAGENRRDGCCFPIAWMIMSPRRIGIIADV
jgi:hypothetical protein